MRNPSAGASSTQQAQPTKRFTVFTLGVETMSTFYPRNRLAQAIHDRTTGSAAHLDVPEDSIQALIHQT